MDIASKIDHTYLKPSTTKKEVIKLCEEAKEYGFAAVCIPPYFVSTAKYHLEDSDVKVATVVGFPMGYSAIPTKVAEINRALDEGVDELDIVVNVSAVKNGDWAHIKNEVSSVTRAAQLKGKIAKIILETGLLNKEEIKKLCKICSDSECDFVKTSTGFNTEGPDVRMIHYLRTNLADAVKIKASGGIRTKADAQKFIKAGADRIGTSSAVKIAKT